MVSAMLKTVPDRTPGSPLAAAPLGAPQAFRWQLAGASGLPPLTAALRIGIAARAAVYRSAEAKGLWPMPDSFHAAGDRGHAHAFWLPEDADEDGRVDHVVLFAASGIPYALLPILAQSARIDLAGLGHWHMLPDWMGHRVPGAIFGPARRWVSATAYVPPFGRKRNGREPPGAAEQLRNEIGMRGIGARLIDIGLAGLVIRGEASLAAEDFTLAARRLSGLPRGVGVPAHWRAPAHAIRSAAMLTFDRPVWGPLALGFGCHFGLGLFEPVDDVPEEGDA